MATNPEMPPPPLPEEMEIPQSEETLEAQQEEKAEGDQGPGSFIIPPDDGFFDRTDFRDSLKRSFVFHKAATKAATVALETELASDPEVVLKFYDSSVNGAAKLMMAAIRAEDSKVKAHSYYENQKTRGAATTKGELEAPKDKKELEPTPEGTTPPVEGATPAPAPDPEAPQAPPTLEPGDLTHSRFNEVNN